MRQTGEKATIAALRRFWNAQNQAEFGTSQVDSSKIMVPWESSNLFESLLALPRKPNSFIRKLLLKSYRAGSKLSA